MVWIWTTTEREIRIDSALETDRQLASCVTSKGNASSDA
jgi:hypothetical protein